MNEIKEEQEYLDYINVQIGNERQSQQELLEAVPWEYKGRYAEVKWGDEDLVDHLTNMYISRLRTIEGLEKKPYFGSFKFDDGYKNENYRIGKTDVLNNGEMLVLDWRNPICTMYYDKSIGSVSYKSPIGLIEGNLINKCQILIEDGEVKSIREVDLVSDDDLLKPYLDVNADSKMKVIIASIQSEQNAIIREPISKNLIIQGVAGSGKTSVALHRIAYLLYNASDKYNASQFAIIGPNKYFLNYVSSILPELDTDEVNNFTYEEIAERIIGEPKYHFETSNEEMYRHLNSNSQYDFIKKLKGSLEYKNAINSFLKDYFSYYLKYNISFNNIEIIDSDYITNGVNLSKGYADNIKLFVKETTNKIKKDWDDIYYDLSRTLMIEMKKYPLKSDERNNVINQMDELKNIIKKGCNKELKKNLNPLLISPIKIYERFLLNVHNYLYLSADEEKYLKEDFLSNLKKKIISYDDIAAILYITILRNNCKDFNNIKEVVMDEAQDYNMFQYDNLRTIFNNSNFSIFGDLAQSIYLHRSIDSWDNVNEKIFNNACSIIEMTKSYRMTKEITEISNLILDSLNLSEAEPVIRNGENIKFTQLDDKNKLLVYLKTLKNFINKGYKSIGIVCKVEEEMQEVAKILDEIDLNYNYINSFDTEYNGGICLLTGYLSKGLEFDGVIITDASINKYSSDSIVDKHLLYVAVTRALHELEIFYKKELTDVFSNSKNKVYTL